MALLPPRARALQHGIPFRPGVITIRFFFFFFFFFFANLALEFKLHSRGGPRRSIHLPRPRKPTILRRRRPSVRPSGRGGALRCAVGVLDRFGFPSLLARRAKNRLRFELVIIKFQKATSAATFGLV